jgi:hypothetical protein
VITSYEIVFVGDRNVANIMREALKMDRKDAEIEITEFGFVCRIGRAEKRLLVLCRGGDVEIKENCLVLMNCNETPKNNIKAVNADKIAKKFGCNSEIPMLGALSKLGILSLKALLAAIYIQRGYKVAIAAKRGYDSVF